MAAGAAGAAVMLEAAAGKTMGVCMDQSILARLGSGSDALPPPRATPGRSAPATLDCSASSPDAAVQGRRGAWGGGARVCWLSDGDGWIPPSSLVAARTR
jgi:CubicO group peptidase (beta-lactamase class C family)